MSRRTRTLLIALAAGMLTMAACSQATTDTTLPAPTTRAAAVTTTEAPPAPVSTSTTDTTATTTPSDVNVPELLTSLPLAAISVNDESLIVAVAETRASRRQGLMAVDDLGDLDGMLFVWDVDTSGSFWMRDTVLALDIAFFAADGSLVNSFSMEPCDLGADCPLYESGGTYRFALETEQGRLGTLASDTTLTFPESAAG